MSDFIKLGDLIRQICSPAPSAAKENWRKAMQSQPETSQPNLSAPGPIRKEVNSFQRNVREAVQLFRHTHLSMHDAVVHFRAAFINVTLADCHGNQCQAAKLLGVHRNTLGREIAEMKKQGLLTAGLRGPGNRQRRKSVQRAHSQANAMGVRVGSA